MFAAAVPSAMLGRQVLVVIAFTIVGSMFIPFSAATLLYLNNRVPWSGIIPDNSAVTNAPLWLVLLLFLAMGAGEISALFSGPKR